MDGDTDNYSGINRAKRQRVLPADASPVPATDSSLKPFLNLKDFSSIEAVRDLRSVLSIERRNVVRTLWLASDPVKFKDTTPVALQGAEAETNMKILWSQKLSRCVDSSPLFVEYGPNSAGETTSRIFIGSHGGDFVSVDALTGEICWTALLGGGVHHIEGAASAACFGQVIIVGSFYGADVDGPREVVENVCRTVLLSEDKESNI